ncbi:Card1-like endonuclease domain-containing protein [Bariatricus sp. HCP28S3_D3]|uniref:Card1-like endonuclease domain-containing protein n=1 Tax=Bariatricus sp. HCP28S3_D3 TaxID=3438901 RepID=UPI003F8BE5F0
MLKAKALCAVNGNAAPEIRPLMSVVEAPAPAADIHGNGLHDLIGGMQNIVIESVGSDEKIPEAVGQLAIRMMKNNVLIKDLLHELRQLYIRGQKDFRLSLAGRSDAEKKQIISLFQDMAGFAGNIRYCTEFQSLNGSLVMMPNAQQFLTGQYLELAVYQTIKDVLQELSVKYHAGYEIYRNVRVADIEGKLKNEFDIAFRFNGIWYIVECKSGKCFSDWGSIADIGLTYNVVPNRLLLVDSFISDSWAQQIEYGCQYYVCNLSANTLQEKVTKMVINDLAA